VAKRIVGHEVRVEPSLLCGALEAAVSTINGSPEAHVLLNPSAVEPVAEAWEALHGRAYLGKKWTDIRIANADYFDRSLKHVVVPCRTPGVTHVYHQYTVRVPAGVDRDQVVARLNQRGVGARVYYARPIHMQPVFAAYHGLHLPETERASREVLSLPVHPSLTTDEREQIAQEVNTEC